MRDALNVLMVAGTPILAGGERNLLDLATYARDRGFTVGLVAPGEGRLPQRMRALGCPIWDVTMTKAPSPVSIIKLRKIIVREGFTTIHAHGHLAGLYARSAAAGLKDVRTIYTLHGIHYPHYGNPLKRAAYTTGDKALKRFTGHFICVCRYDLETGTRLGIVDPDRTSVIQNGIGPLPELDPSRVAGLRQRYDRGGGIILHAGRFRPEKDHHTLIEAVPLVLEKHPDAVFLLAGSGKLLEREKEHAAGLGEVAGSIHFLGESSEVDMLMQACDLMVLPSLWEGFPYVVLEAMRAAKPVVATDSGGTSEAVEHGKTGLLIKPGDPRTLAAAICRLLADPREAAAMGRRGRDRLEDFSLESMARQTLGLYTEAISC